MNMEINLAGYIYLLADKVNNTYKIGRTKNLEQRIRSIKTGNPNQIDLIAYAICNNTVASEKRIHNLYSLHLILCSKIKALFVRCI